MFGSILLYLIFFIMGYFLVGVCYRDLNIPEIRISNAIKKKDFYKAAKLLFYQKTCFFEWMKENQWDMFGEDIFVKKRSPISTLSLSDQEKVMILVMRRYKASSRIRKAIFLEDLSAEEVVVFEEYSTNDGCSPFWETALQTAGERCLDPSKCSEDWREYFSDILAFVFRSEVNDEKLKNYFKLWLSIHSDTECIALNDKYIDQEGKRRGYNND